MYVQRSEWPSREKKNHVTSTPLGAPQVGSTYQRFNVKTADLMHLFLLRGPQLQEETVKL